MRSDPFKPALWDGSDPLYAPCMRRVKRWFYWRPPARYITAGYNKSPIRLPGEDGDGQDLPRAQKARDLTREMLRWFNAEEALVEPGTWQWLIARYKSDEFSPFKEVKENTAQNYLWCLSRWEEAIGKVKITDTDHVALRRWQKAAQDGQEARQRAENARRRDAHLAALATDPEARRLPDVPVDGTAYVKRLFTALRIVVSYGVSIRAPGAAHVREILSAMRIKSTKPRKVAPTDDEVLAIIAAADAAGEAAFALGLSCQWWLTLRAVDVRGQWLGRGSQKRWADGLTWDMISKDLTLIRKTPSKTERSMADEMEFDLTLLPDLRARLLAIPREERIGPVIKRNGTPITPRHWLTLFRKFARAAGVPDEVWMMDTRSGAINHARRLGASPILLQHQANHTNMKTTDRYIRGRSESVREVIALRSGTTKQPI